MAIDPIQFDNPLNTENVDRDAFPIQFPALHEFNPAVARQSAACLFGGVLLCVILAYLFAQASLDAALKFAGISRLMVVILTVAVVIRWESRSQFAFYATGAVSAISLFATATLSFIPGGGALNAVCSLTMLTMLWTAAEIAIHFQSIDVEVIRRDPAIAQQRRQQKSNALQILAVVVGILQCLSFWTPMRLVAVPIAAFMVAAIAYSLMVGIAKYPARFLWLTIQHYLGYPESSSLVPGLIRSPAPQPFLRLLPFVFVVVGATLIVIAEQEMAEVWVEASLMAVNGVMVGLTALLLGASLSARPVHFDVDRTPFDVVVSKLRAEENVNV